MGKPWRLRMAEYPRYRTEGRLMKNKRGNPRRCAVCGAQSTCTLVTEVSPFRGEDLVEPRCKEHRREPLPSIEGNQRRGAGLEDSDG